MPLSPEMDQKIRVHLEELIQEGTELVSMMKLLVSEKYYDPSRPELISVCVPEFNSFAGKSGRLIRCIFRDTAEGKEYQRRIGKMESHSKSAEAIVGILSGLQSDFESGFLGRLQDLVIAEISADYLGLAEELLDTHEELKDGYGRHIPAASVSSAVLEHFLRLLCQRLPSPIPLEFESKGKTKAKNLERLITDLQTEKVISVSKANLLRSWAQLRNSVDHGRFTEAPPKEVKDMILGVKSFLEDMQ